ncbi:MAG: signal peptidase II [Spirochaetales bacterium]
MKRIVPLIIAALLIVADQASKLAVVALIPLNTVGWASGGDFLWLVHVRNTGVAFSMGNNLPDWLRVGLFILIPLGVMIAFLVYYWRDATMTQLQRWSLALIVAGGLGNQVDRIFRPEGVVDFLSFRLYGLFGMERFAIFNVADVCINVGGALFVLSLLFGMRKR